MLIIDRYAYNNRLTDTSPYLKFGLVSFSLILSIGFKNNYLNLFLFLGMSILITIVAGIPLRAYFKVLKIPSVFLLLSMVTILVSVSKDDIFLYSFNLFSSNIGILETSLTSGLKLFTTVLASISATFFLSLTTPLIDIIAVLKKIKLPDTIIELLILIYRFIFIFLEESKNIYASQEIRFGHISIKKSLESTSLLIRSLILRVFLRYKDMVISLDCKLYDGKFKTGD